MCFYALIAFCMDVFLCRFAVICIAGNRHAVDVLSWLAGTTVQGVFVVDGEVTDIIAGELAPEVVDLENVIDDDIPEDMETENEGYSGCLCLSFVSRYKILIRLTRFSL